MGGTSSSTASQSQINPMVSPKPSEIEAQVAIEPTDMICELQTFTTVFRAKINCYWQLELCPINFRIDCGTFDLAGHQWAVSYQPKINNECVSYQIRLLTETAASMHLTVECSLIGPSGRSAKLWEKRGTYNQQYNELNVYQYQTSVAKYVKDDCFSFELTVTVAKWTPSKVMKNKPELAISSSNFQEDLGWLLENRKGADISFEVSNDGFSEIVVAHKIVLAARSPVFRAQLSGFKTEGNRECIKVDDMEGTVFKAILHYLYTDELPQGELSFEMAKQLFVAADKYGLDRVKLICAQELCDFLNFETATSVLVLAEQYNCQPLVDACLEFVSTAHKVVRDTDKKTL